MKKNEISIAGIPFMTSKMYDIMFMNNQLLIQYSTSLIDCHQILMRYPNNFQYVSKHHINYNYICEIFIKLYPDPWPHERYGGNLITLDTILKESDLLNGFFMDFNEFRMQKIQSIKKNSY